MNPYRFIVRLQFNYIYRVLNESGLNGGALFTLKSSNSMWNRWEGTYTTWMGFLGAFTGRQNAMHTRKATYFDVNEMVDIVVITGLNLDSRAAPTSPE